MKKHKLLPRILVALIIIIALILLGGRLYFRLPVSDYYRASETLCDIPGLTEGFVPQGLDWSEELERLLFTGYTTDHSASPVYVTDRDGRLEKRVTLKKADGSEVTSHNGGLEAHGGLLYICDSEEPCLRVFSLNDLASAKNGGALTEIGTVPLMRGGDVIGPAFVEAGPNGLIVGEFYRAGNYETPVSHYAGEHHALAVELPYNDSALGVSEVPSAAWSLPDLAQGMCFDERGRMYISESWGTAFSVIEVFAPGEPDGEIEVLGERVPLTMLGDANRVSSAKAAPMSEEMVILNGRLLINCESASMKYFFGWLTGGQKLYATDVGYFCGE